MQGGLHHQTGGFVDPGLAALIAALLSGGVSGYGYVREKNKSKEEIQAAAASALTDAQQKIIAAAQSAQADAARQIEEAKKKDERLEKVEEENKALRRQNDLFRSKSTAIAGPNAVFQKATHKTLEDAIDGTIANLKALEGDNRKWLKTVELTNLKEALKYPVNGKGRLSRPSLSTFYTSQIVPALKKDFPGSQAPRGGKRRYRRRMRGGEDTNIPTEEEFAAAYEQAINEATRTVKEGVEKESAKARADVDAKVKEKKATKANEAARKAAGLLADKLEKEVANAKAEIEKSEKLIGVLSKDRQAKILPVRNELQNLIKQAEAADYLGGEVAAKKKGVFRGGALRDIKEENDTTKALREKGQTLLTDLQAKAKEFVEGIKSQKEDEAKSFKSPPIRFGLPVVKISIGNPFAGLIETLVAAKSKTDQVNAIRTQSKEAVTFIKTNIKNAKKMIKEIDSLAGVKAEKTRATLSRAGLGGAEGDEDETDAEGDGAATPGSAAVSEGSDESAGTEPKETRVEEQDECATIRSDERFQTGDLLWFRDNMRAIVKGGEEDVGSVKRTYDAGKNMDAEYIALEASLDKLNTGILSSTMDWFKSVRGKQLTYGIGMFVHAGNAYARLRCYVDKAQKLLQDPDRKTRVQRAMSALRSAKSAVSSKSGEVVTAQNTAFSAPGTDAAAEPSQFSAPGTGNEAPQFSAPGTGNEAPQLSASGSSGDSLGAPVPVTAAALAAPAQAAPAQAAPEVAAALAAPAQAEAVPEVAAALAAPAQAEAAPEVAAALPPAASTFAPRKPVRAPGETPEDYAKRLKEYEAMLALTKNNLRSTGQKLWGGGRRRSSRRSRGSRGSRKARKRTLKKRRGGK